MLREAKNAAWAVSGHWPLRRRVFTAGRLVATRGLRPAEHAALEREQRDAAVAVLRAPGGRTYWWCMDRFWWGDDGLEPADVLALVHERHVRARRRLTRARGPPPPAPPAPVHERQVRARRRLPRPRATLAHERALEALPEEREPRRRP